MKDPCDRVVLAGIVVSTIVALRFIFIVDSSIGGLITYAAALAFFVYLWRVIDASSITKSYAYSDPDGPDHGWEPRTVEAVRHRAEGIE